LLRRGCGSGRRLQRGDDGLGVAHRGTGDGRGRAVLARAAGCSVGPRRIRHLIPHEGAARGSGLTLPSRIAIATRNEHKLRELTRICADWPVEWITIRTDPDLPWPDPDETGSTYLENARIKATEVRRALEMPAIADDSGIEVDALGGGPGARSARFASETATDEQNLSALLRAKRGVPRAGASARYRCVAVLSAAQGDFVEEGTCDGTLATKPRGTGGF